MPMRDWGIGLEDLTDYYHRYGLRFTDKGINKDTETWILMKGIIDQVVGHRKKLSSRSSRGFSPREIDFVGLRINHQCELKEVRLIQCRETVNSGDVDKILESMEYVPYLTGIIENARTKQILSKYVTYVKISKTAKEQLEKEGMKLLSFKEMVNKLLLHLNVLDEIGRKGFMREPILWVLQSLKNNGYLKSRHP